jgi:fructokinase
LNPLSEDRFGLLLRNALGDAGVKHLGAVSAKPTSLALVSANEQGQPSYSFYREAVADRDLTPVALTAAIDASITGFHTGGLALVPPDHEVVLAGLRHARELGVLRTVDVNLRPQVANSMGVSLARYRDAVFAVIKEADIVKVSDEDLRHLGITSQPQAAARELLAFGCHLVVLTLGASGAWVLNRNQALFKAAERVNVVDTVGAGDCFFAGFVAALLRASAVESVLTETPVAGLLERALTHATRCAAINISRQGCQPPTWDEAVGPPQL